MTEKTPFDPKALTALDKNVRKLVDEQYELCNFRCAEKNTGGLQMCKDNCFKKVVVPYRYNLHASRDQEENAYKRCLATKFPNVTPDDFVECTNQLYKDRVEILSSFVFENCERILGELH